MSRAVWIAFAMSLMILPLRAEEPSLVDLSELEAELLPELVGPQRFTPETLHQKADWQVKVKDVVVDKEPLKGQGHSLIPWETLDPEEWLGIQSWLLESEMKKKFPDWKLRLRDDRQLELVGKVLSCQGHCPVFRGTMPAPGQHLSRLLEGDEIRTEKDSVAWLFLIDGTLVRLGPEGSLSLQEINLSKKELFILARLNKGHIFWHPRRQETYPLVFAPETEAKSLPLRILPANLAHFERQIFQTQSDLQRLQEVLDLEEGAVKAQTKALNELREENDKFMTLPTKAMVVAPNVTLVSPQVSFDLIYVPGGSGYFKKRGPDSGELEVLLRGYSETQVLKLDSNDWQEASKSGRSFTKMFELPPTLQLLELLTKRIRTLELAREHWVREFTRPLLAALSDPKALAIEHGYSLWEEGENEKRLAFLVEYTRRIETTNIKSIDNLLLRISESGTPVSRELSVNLYEDALNHYLLGLKTRYTQNRMKVREMNDLQYYVWTLKNGKL